MRNQSPQPSQIVFPVALQPAEMDAAPRLMNGEPWGWLEVFVIVQVFWGVLLFLPGPRPYRTYIRAFPYVDEPCRALAACARSSGADSVVPGARWMIAALCCSCCNLVHPATWLTAGVAQVVFQLSIAAPVFWAARCLDDRIASGAADLARVRGELRRVRRSACFRSTTRRRFCRPSSARWAAAEPRLRERAQLRGRRRPLIVRPPGLSDLPGGAAIAGTTARAAGLWLCRAARTSQNERGRRILLRRLWASRSIYLTQVRSMLLMILLHARDCGGSVSPGPHACRAAGLPRSPAR